MDTKKDSEVLAEIYRNAQLALISISDLLPQLEEGEIKKEILSEFEEYEKISAAASMLAKDKGLELKEPSGMKKAMMWSSVKMKSAVDNSTSNIAQMMIKGTVTGITCLKTTLTDCKEGMDAEIESLLKRLISLEEDFEKRLKKHL